MLIPIIIQASTSILIKEKSFQHFFNTKIGRMDWREKKYKKFVLWILLSRHRMMYGNVAGSIDLAGLTIDKVYGGKEDADSILLLFAFH